MTTFSRRRVLAGAVASIGALSMPRVLRAQSTPFDCDAVIIGAGAAGLAAANHLSLAHKTFVMIEARDRIGGRVFTDTSLGIPFDLGATYIHNADENPWRDLAETLGFEAVSARGRSSGQRLFVNGLPIERQRDQQAGERFWSRLDSDDGDVPDVSIADRFVGEPAQSQQRAVTLSRLEIGEEAEKVSAQDYARLWGGPDFLVPAGFGQLVAAYGKNIPVKLSTRASMVDWSGAGVRVATDAGTIWARAAIITVSAGVLAAESLKFTPSLPEATLSAINGLGMGSLTRIALAFDGERFGVPPDMWLIDTAGRSDFQYQCWSFNRNLVVAWYGGNQAREMTRLGERDAIAAALDHFALLVGREARSHFVAGRASAWDADPLALGCYSHARPGHAGARELLDEPVAGRLYFAGEATGGAPHDDYGPAMTAGGAFLAGQAAARYIAES